MSRNTDIEHPYPALYPNRSIGMTFKSFDLNLLPFKVALLMIGTQMNTTITKTLQTLALTLGLISTSTPLLALDSWPSKPIKIVVPVPAGASLDTLARTIGKGISEKLGQPVVVENMAGGGSNIAFSYVSKAAPDGYTLLLGWDSLVINPSLYANPPYKLEQFAPVTMAITAPQVPLVGPKLPVKNLRSLIEYARLNPGKITLANAGNGSPGHLAGALLESMADIKFTNVPYKGGAPGVADLIAGHVDAMFVTLPAALQYVRSGKLTALGVSNSKRSTGAPNIPTIAEAGLPGYELNSWQGILAPAGTSQAIINKLNKEIVLTLRQPAVKEQLVSQGFEIVASSPEYLGKQLAILTPKWAKLVKESGAKID
ncbi:MAG TPA: tripartite tricarboxylate transporter substrate binding protein [Polynucleobacter sp.]|nr:tripartite tricarboxylate transporter substrate binding protein [Polynucleobacter sp.]